MTANIDCKLDHEDLLALIDYYDKSITELEKKLAEKRYSYKCGNSQRWLTETESTRRKISELRQKVEYFVNMHDILFNANYS